ncbi:MULTISPECIES: hypothetical protein [unclassified Coleofasciculus]|uniref:hypothetical protein n=1 Tax=unclassified Coleofasciculus TaxID=2692782 RepID=UPI00187F79D6|nr:MULTISPECIES: hypothetical protein [unclassified Coleofasciculus]MBE9129263.1 hypothetical protein [Coleofasciculus sp. LEGE 07081]MBE9147431.1 hypothetical protein [Coleofasciculus sp. LEGE 07092]
MNNNKGNCQRTISQAIANLNNFSLPKSILRYCLLGNGWFPSLTLGLLVTVLALIGTLPAAQADEGNLDVGESESAATDWVTDVTAELEGSSTPVALDTAAISSATIEQETTAATSPDDSLAAESDSAPVDTHSGTAELLVNERDTPSNLEEIDLPTRERLLDKQQEEFPTEAEPTTDTLAPDEVRILAPQPGVIGDRATNLIIQYNADSQVQVNVNQQPLNPDTPTTTEVDETQNIITQVWYGIELKEGDNTITVSTGEGSPASVQLTVKPTAVELTLSPVGDPRVPADGRSIITLEGRITNENGEQIAEDAVVTLTAEVGTFVGADYDDDQLGFQILAKNGQFSARLQSGLDARKVRIRAAIETLGAESEVDETIIGPSTGFSSETIEAYTQVEFVTHLRPSLVSGFVNLRIGPSGTNYWGSRRDFLSPDNIDEGTEIDLSSAIFATGRIGEWLFTGAFNTEHPLNETCDGITRLFQGPQFCEQQYPVYGDSSTTDYLTPSTDEVYLRFERTSAVPGAEPDYGMWGDYHTTELSRASQFYTATARALHGFKGNYNLGNLQITALYSPDVEGFQRDTIAPDGTSGYYFVSRRLLIPGSETLFVESEELNRPGTVVERQRLSRGADYEIDYDRGSILFRRPIRQVEFDPFGNTLVKRIVVTYQYEADDDTNIYGGRLQYNFSQEFEQESWAGATYLTEDQGIQDFELYGADFFFPLGSQGRIVGEYAHSSNESPFLGTVTGNAYRLEISGTLSSAINANAYYRSVEEGFANNATTSFTPGQTRYGANVTAQLSSTTNVLASYDHEDNFGTAPQELDEFEVFDLFNPGNIFNPGVEAVPGSLFNNSLTTIRAGVQQKIGRSDLTVEYVNRSREDHANNTFDSNASQFVSRLNVPITNSLAFRAQNELNLSDDEDPLYPSRTTLGLDWDVYPGVTLRLAHQFFDGGLLGDNSITTLDTLMEQQWGENTTLTSRYSIISGLNGIRGQQAVGLNHRWVVAPGLRINFGYERIANDIFGETAASDRFPYPYAVGQSSSALGLFEGESYSVAAEYTPSPDFKASARFEHRDNSSGDNTVFSAAAAGKISPALTALFRYQQASGANQLLEGLGDTASLKLGMAYRNPYDDRFNALLRYEYRKNPSTIPDSLLFDSGTGSRDHVFSAEGIYAPNWRWEYYGKFALRNSTTDLAEDFSNSSTIYLGQLRATYRLGYRVDLAVEGRWIGQSSVNFDEWGWAVEGGYYVTPDLRVGVGYSFGSVDDRDFSGFRSEGGPYLSVTFKVNELLDGFGRQKVVPPQQQESVVQPVAGTNPAMTIIPLSQFPLMVSHDRSAQPSLLREELRQSEGNHTNNLHSFGVLSISPISDQPAEPLRATRYQEQ